MTERLTIKCINPVQARAALMSRLWPWVKAMTVAQHEVRIEAKPASRSGDQNAKFHAIVSDIARSPVQWAGKRRTAAEWKVLLVSGHATATKLGADMVPGLEGEFVNLRESTARMSVSRASSLIEYSLAFCVAHNVRLSAQEE